MAEFGDDVEATFESFVSQHGFLSMLGVEFESIEPGRVTVCVPYDETLTNPARNGSASVHGGVASTLVDTASAFALRTTFEEPDAVGLATIDISVSYLRPAVGDLLGTAEVIRAGGHVGVTRVTVESETPTGEVQPVATGMTNYRLFRDG
ncbi:MAG: PaaI family thioesterase [Halobacteriota archaeon]